MYEQEKLDTINISMKFEIKNKQVDCFLYGVK